MDKLIYFWISVTIVILDIINLTNGGETRSSHCVSTCSCDGQKIDCTDKQLYQIPDLSILQIYIHSINFSNNEIETLTTSNFIFPRLARLQELQLDSNAIFDIEETSFDSLPNLTYLDISNNILESVSDHMVEKNTKLRQLNLANNVFNRKTPKLISKSLEILDLSSCKISHFNESHIKNLPSLKVLHLRVNTLTHIQHHIFDKLPITYVSLSYNYWKCNCDSLRLFHHLIHRNITIGDDIQCLHQNNLFEKLTDLSEPIFDKKFCMNESKEVHHMTESNKTHKLHHTKHHMTQKHNQVEKQEEGGFNQSCTIFTGAIIGVVIVSLAASIVAWKITNNKRIKPLVHHYETPSHTRLIQKA